MKAATQSFVIFAALFLLTEPVFAAKAAMPVFNPSPGAYAGEVTVSITSATGGATIRYTTDGSTPTEASAIFSAPLTFTSTTTLSARAFASGKKKSLVTAGVYTITGAVAVAAPAFSPAPGAYGNSVQVTISTTTSGATIRFTTNGNTPSANSPLYTGPLTFTSATTLKARAFKNGLADSDVTAGVYTIRPAVFLLLHGLDSSPSTWDDLVSSELGGNCAEITLPFTNFPSAPCYRYRFITRPSPDGDEWEHGDGATFDQLGAEVAAAAQKIAGATNPGAIILVGHSRGGLAARAYLQSLSTTPSFKLLLLTIGTPHQGTPLGRMKVWMDQQHYTWRDVNIFIRSQTRFLFSPSTGNLASNHDKKKNPKRTAISEAIFALNDGASALGAKAAVFGQIVSTGMRLGENTVGPLDLLDGTSVASFLPGDFNSMKSFVIQNLPDDWQNDGDGMVPSASARLTQLPGFSFSPGVWNTTLVEISHTSETGQTAAIKRMLDTMVGNFPLSAAREGGEESIAARHPVVNEAAQDLEGRLSEAARRLSGADAGQVADSLIRAMRTGDGDALNAAMEIIVARFRLGDHEAVDSLIGWLPLCADDEKAAIVSLLGRMPNVQSVRTLVDLALGNSARVRQAALKQLSQVGRGMDKGEQHHEVSELLREVLQSGVLQGRTDLVASLALGLSSMGTESNVESVLNFLENHREDAQGWSAAASGLQDLRDSSAIAPLAKLIDADPGLSDKLTRVAGDTLAAMGRPEATEVLLRWAAEQEDDRLIEQASSWLRRVRDSASLRLLIETARSETFRSVRLKEHARQIAGAINARITPALIEAR